MRRNRLMVVSSARRRKGGRGLVVEEGCIARSGRIRQGRDTSSIAGRRERKRGTDGDYPNGHCDVRGSRAA